MRRKTVNSNLNPLLIAMAAFLIVLGISGSVFAVEKPFEQPIENKSLAAESNSRSISDRFSDPDETPDFQRHVAPLLGRLGCNGRACHGSFQGQGGFQLSLFGYDFSSDHSELMDGRIDLEHPAESLLLTKPTDEDNHEGGLRYEVGSWQYNLLRSWVKAGAKAEPTPHRLDRLVVEPAELQLADPNEEVTLRATAHWADGTVEDVTELCRFKSNDDSVAKITDEGSVSTLETPGDTHVVVSYDSAVVPVPVVHRFTSAKNYVRPVTPTKVDELVVNKLEKLGIQQSEVSDDAMFLRRVSLDITGTLPSPAEVRKFLANTDTNNKRQQKIDELLESSAYSAWWATFFCDMTENNTRQLRNVSFNANDVSKQWYTWIKKRVENNTPYDEMITGIVLGVSRNSDEEYREYCERMSDYFRNDNGEEAFAEGDSMPYYWMRQEFQNRETRAISFAHAFLGLRIQCAQCHKHPFDQWSQDDFNEFAKFFSGVSFRNRATTEIEKIVEADLYKELGIDPKKKNMGNIRRKIADCLKDGKTVPFSNLQIHKPKPTQEETKAARKSKKKPQGPTSAKLLGGDPIDLKQFDDIRKPLMDWMNERENPYFARALVNRVWTHYFGVGIVDPADDLNLANPPSNAELLDYLATEFVNQGYDLKWLHREITNSRTYQLSWKTNETNLSDRKNFSRALPRRLPAEVVFDAVSSAASNPETNREFRDEIENRAISIPGTQGYGNNKNKKGAVNSTFALQVFGRSERSSSCDCDRSEETSLIQTVYLQNDRDIQTMLTQKGSWVNQMAQQQQSKLLSDTEQRQLNSFNKQIAQTGQAIEKLVGKKSAKHEKQVKILRKKKQKIEERASPLRKRIAKARQDADDIDLTEFVDEAYLRTLSRFPSDEENQRCVEFIKQDKDLIKGVTGVLWALVNTKEFIVNH